MKEIVAEIYKLMILGFLKYLVIGLLLLGIIIYGGIRFYKVVNKKTFEFESPLIPEKKLVIKNNQVDTVYVYKFK